MRSRSCTTRVRLRCCRRHLLHKVSEYILRASKESCVKVDAQFILRRGGVLLIAALLALAGCEKKAVAPPQAPPPQAVTTASVITRDVPIYLDEIGKCVAPEIVSVQPQVSGRITELHFKEGADLKKGDTLFTIDPRPFQAQLEQAKADLELSKAALEQSEAALKQNQAQIEAAQA